MQGWIKLHRSLISWEWYDHIPSKVLFIHLLLKVNHKENSYRGKVVKKGHVLTSREVLAKETGLTERQIRTALNNLKSTNEIAIKSSRQGTEIKVVKYSEYQTATNETTNERPTNDQRTTSNKNDNKDNNEEYFFNKRENLKTELANSSTMLFGIAQRLKVKSQEFKESLVLELINIFATTLSNDELERRIDEQRRHCANWILLEIEKINRNGKKQTAREKTATSYGQTFNDIKNSDWSDVSN